VKKSFSLLPLGRSGLKHQYSFLYPLFFLSPSAWKEWIETAIPFPINPFIPSPSAWKEWIETSVRGFSPLQYSRLLPLGRSGLKLLITVFGQRWCDMSPSAWKEWIETTILTQIYIVSIVSFRLEGVD